MKFFQNNFFVEHVLATISFQFFLQKLSIFTLPRTHISFCRSEAVHVLSKQGESICDFLAILNPLFLLTNIIAISRAEA